MSLVSDFTLEPGHKLRGNDVVGTSLLKLRFQLRRSGTKFIDLALAFRVGELELSDLELERRAHLVLVLELRPQLLVDFFQLADQIDFLHEFRPLVRFN